MTEKTRRSAFIAPLRGRARERMSQIHRASRAMAGRMISTLRMMRYMRESLAEGERKGKMCQV